MRRTAADKLAPPLYAAVDLIVILIPAFAVKLTAGFGGMADPSGVDLIVASTLLGVGHAWIAWSRLRSEERMAVRRADIWIAAFDALVVLALAATLLPVTVLWRFPDEHASMANQGYPVVALWTGLQLTAVAMAEVTGRLVFWWLEPHPPLHRVHQTRIQPPRTRDREPARRL